MKDVYEIWRMIDENTRKEIVAIVFDRHDAIAIASLFLRSGDLVDIVRNGRFVSWSES